MSGQKTLSGAAARNYRIRHRGRMASAVQKAYDIGYAAGAAMGTGDSCARMPGLKAQAEKGRSAFVFGAAAMLVMMTACKWLVRGRRH